MFPDFEESLPCSEINQFRSRVTKSVCVRMRAGAWLLVLLLARAGTDQRCLLRSGGSTETFFVREDAGPGAVVGRLQVNIIILII